MSDSPLIIIVAGDTCIDWFACPVPRIASVTPLLACQPANWQLRDGLRMFARAGGAWLLAELVETAAGQPVIRQSMPMPLEHQACDQALHSMVELKPFPLSNAGKDRQDRRTYVWRVGRFRGFAGPEQEQTKSARCRFRITRKPLTWSCSMM